jgi:hypothetical protein
MTTTTLPAVPAWLLTFCSRDEGRGVLCQPFPIEYDGAPAVAATNGHKLALVPGAYDVETPTAPTPGTIPAIVASALARPARRVRLDVLRAFCGVRPFGAPCDECDATGAVDCPECGGVGTRDHECSCGHEHEAPCEMCDGDGDIRCENCRGPATPEVQPIDVGGAHFNRLLLGDVVRALPDDRHPVAWHDAAYTSPGTDSGTAAALVGPGWIALVMPMRRRDEVLDTFTAWEPVA